MATTSKTKITINLNGEEIELKGAELDAFLEQRIKDQAEANALLIEKEAQKQLKISAYRKLGLTDEEINAII